MSAAIPNEFVCPISGDVMRDPVWLSTGIAVDRTYAEYYLQAGFRQCPVTGETITDERLVPVRPGRRVLRSSSHTPANKGRHGALRGGVTDDCLSASVKHASGGAAVLDIRSLPLSRSNSACRSRQFPQVASLSIHCAD